MEIKIYPNNGKSYNLLSKDAKNFLKKYIKVYYSKTESKDIKGSNNCTIF